MSISLDQGAAQLQEFLAGEGVAASLEECRHLIVCDFLALRLELERDEPAQQPA